MAGKATATDEQGHRYSDFGREAVGGREKQMTGIYVVQSGSHCKVGISGNIRARMNSLQNGSPYTLALAYSGECGNLASRLEAEAHAILEASRKAGEWFAVSAEDAVKAVLSAAASLGIELLPIEVRAIKSRGARQKWVDNMIARFPEGTFERIAAVLEGSEDRTDFVREAVERELKRREKSKKR